MGIKISLDKAIKNMKLEKTPYPKSFQCNWIKYEHPFDTERHNNCPGWGAVKGVRVKCGCICHDNKK